ncbi:protein kinase domain-containing protein [Nodularia chucula]|uniref:serine/threonine protein kinase n=1 Tax=Nodularia chucula TaxID=3093667 RepID=UPI0039C5F2A2
MSHITQTAVHCINPECKRPYPQPWGNKFCNSCGTLLQLLDRYVPLQPLGSGGFSQIYTVWDQKTQQEKVLKVLVDNSPKALELFTQEAEVLINLRHPGVPRVEPDGYFQVNLPTAKPRQLACLVMEKINGQTLEKVLEKYPQGCPEHLVLDWFSQAVNILQELHKRQIIHRDIKPSNLMLRRYPTNVPQLPGGNNEQLVLIDFGGVKQTTQKVSESSSTKLYSSGYSPSEQITGSKVSPGADFYALGRTMIELLTGKYPPELEHPQTGVLQWRNQVQINHKFADLLDEMVLEDVRSRPGNAQIIQKRLTKIRQTSSPLQFFSKISNSVKQAATDIERKFTLFIQDIQQGIFNLTKAISQTVIVIGQAIFQVLQACIATIWAMVITTLTSSIGTVIGFLITYRTDLDEQITTYLLPYLPELVNNVPSVVGTEIIVFASAGLGTAWGITTSGSFGQRRRFLITPLMGMMSYGLSSLVFQLITTKDSGEGLLAVILVGVFLLTLNIGFRSDHVIHALVTALGTATIFATLIIFGFPTTVFEFYPQSESSALYLPLVFFSLVSLLMSFWLGVSYYLIVPGLKFLGWR